MPYFSFFFILKAAVAGVGSGRKRWDDSEEEEKRKRIVCFCRILYAGQDISLRGHGNETAPPLGLCHLLERTRLHGMKFR